MSAVFNGIGSHSCGMSVTYEHRLVQSLSHDAGLVVWAELGALTWVVCILDTPIVIIDSILGSQYNLHPASAFPKGGEIRCIDYA